MTPVLLATEHQPLATVLELVGEQAAADRDRGLPDEVDEQRLVAARQHRPQPAAREDEAADPLLAVADVEVLGVAVNCGGHRGGGSMTAPNPESVERCIRGALADGVLTVLSNAQNWAFVIVRDGEQKLRGFYRGQIMRRSQGKADPRRAPELVRRRVGGFNGSYSRVP